MKRITIVIAACFVYMLFVSVFGFINNNESRSKKAGLNELSEPVSYGNTEPFPPPPPPPRP